jgi:hypothetical protein
MMLCRKPGAIDIGDSESEGRRDASALSNVCRGTSSAVIRFWRDEENDLGDFKDGGDGGSSLRISWTQ